jgi:hypothetical protein
MDNWVQNFYYLIDKKDNSVLFHRNIPHISDLPHIYDLNLSKSIKKIIIDCNKFEILYNLDLPNVEDIIIRKNINIDLNKFIFSDNIKFIKIKYSENILNYNNLSSLKKIYIENINCPLLDLPCNLDTIEYEDDYCDYLGKSKIPFGVSLDKKPRSFFSNVWDAL